jgi:hypothetical protein
VVNRAELKVTARKAYGFRTFRALQISPYHALGHLPQPKVTHRFCGGPQLSFVSVSQFGVAILAMVISRSSPGLLRGLGITVLVLHTTWRGVVVAMGG